ncbi:hypothetical protein Tdes44962_MAKER02612 [Teratosphaeria destructans]|uniref:Uncharacterized protein n=1 Tax=Teratosphaeria destructans TaxID=418781 RepID=A0A9W7SSZ9_9PEZI|nr:hypothetical protein Tdes44962_MAKER02612 [Teratosphaeria destructans]
MPGYRRPPTTAFAPADSRGYDLLEKAFKGRQYPPALDDSALARHKSLGVHRYSVPSTFLLSPSSDSESLSSDRSDAEEKPRLNGMLPSKQEQEESKQVRPPAGRLVTPPHLTQTGLPPTPPTMANSDDMEPGSGRSATNAHLAGAVRSVLTAERSQVYSSNRQLLTPEPSPPRTSTEPHVASMPAARSNRNRQQTQPSAVPHGLQRYPSSRAESFHTACEDPNASQAQLSRAASPDTRSAAAQQRSGSNGGKQVAGVGLGLQVAGVDLTMPGKERQEQAHAQSQDLKPDPTQQLRQRSHSPWDIVRADSDFDKHISYIADEDHADERPSVEDMNNMIYSQIREENLKRHSALSSTHEPIPASVVFPQDALKAHKLRRAPKAHSLRNFSASSVVSHGDSITDAPRQLRHKKALTPRSVQSSPVVASNVGARRFVTEPVMSSSGMSKLTEDFSNGGAKPLSQIPQALGGASENRVRQHSLRRSPKVNGLDSKLPQLFEQQSPSKLKAERTGRQISIDNKHVRNNSVDTNGSILSSPQKGLQADPRFPHPSTTPFSTSQMSDRTEVELCEATAVNIYPHHNDSLLAIQNCSTRPLSNVRDMPAAPNHSDIPTSQQVLETFLADKDLASNGSNLEDLPPASQLNPAIHVDSPLTNPRPAPEPPVIQFIPPTPSDELDRQLDLGLEAGLRSRPLIPQRQETLVQRARRYSESFIVQPLFGRALSGRRPKRAIDDDAAADRPTHLSPLWRPNYIWEGYDSDDDYEMIDDEDDVLHAALPRGGDTSEIMDSRKQQRNSFLARNLSVRMPGFRGQGGFLLGNSLGLERHGSNNRRHYVSAKRSTGGLHTNVSGGYVTEIRKTRSLRSHSSEGMLRQIAGKRRVFSLPFSTGKKMQNISPRRLRDKVGNLRAEREEKNREKKRQALRELITHRKYEGT